MGDVLAIGGGAIHPMMAGAESLDGGEGSAESLGHTRQTGAGSELEIVDESGIGVWRFAGQGIPNTRGGQILLRF